MAEESSPNKEIQDPLLTFLANNYQAEYDDARKIFSQGLVSSLHLGKLFRPNQIIIARNAETQAVRGGVLSLCTSLETGDILLRGWGWKYDGAQLTRTHWKGYVGALSDEPSPILDLTIYPLDFATEEQKEFLALRGKQFWNTRGQTYVSYKGWDAHRKRYYTGERFMIDVLTYRKIHHDVTMGDADEERSFFALDQDDYRSEGLDQWPTSMSMSSADLPSEMFLLFPLTMEGYDMAGREWDYAKLVEVRLQVGNFHPIAWNTQAFDSVALEEGKKRVIQALVSAHKTDVQNDMDIVKGKGTGLIILLHGPPGVGTTVTAEWYVVYALYGASEHSDLDISVTEAVQKPLFRATCGSIGTEPEEAERYLESVMYLSRTWNAVLLLDEADVFLEGRTRADLKRNALVSVFLRTLEYYQGILILTTNRVGTFDEAFRSRIDLAIGYNPLTAELRLQIWKHCLRLNQKDAKVNIEDLQSHLHELASHDFNGRQIRGAVKAALDLARFSGVPMGWCHICEAVENISSFTQDLLALQNNVDEFV
ncbi:hypothetical protein LTR96_009193 [Exophiala xenobiotica]|nr:hypothetical protein LTR96_009193 [Exophiala xenobiotica]